MGFWVAKAKSSSLKTRSKTIAVEGPARPKNSFKKVWRRPTSGQADPMGGDFPLVTKEGHHVLDVIFTSPILDLGQVAESLDQIAGVVDHGIIFTVNPCVAIVASKNGVAIVDKKSSVIS